MALLLVLLGDRRHAFRLEDVVEVQRSVAIAPLPAAPEVVEGVIDLRGQVVPVVDIRARLGLPARDLTPDQHLAIVRAGDRTVAVRVDAALGTHSVDPGDVDSSVTDLPGIQHVAGVARDGEGIVLVQDLAALLSWREAEQLDDALRGEQVAT